MCLQGCGRVVNGAAGDRYNAALATGQSRTLPDVAEDEIQDPGMTVGRHRSRRRHQVHVGELLRPSLYPLLPVVVAEGVIGEHGPGLDLSPAFGLYPGPLPVNGSLTVRGFRPAAVHRKLQYELEHLLELNVAAVERRIDMVLNRLRRVGGGDACERHPSAIPPAQARAGPHLPEDEVASGQLEGRGCRGRL